MREDQVHVEVQEHGVRGQICISHPPEPLVPLVTVRGNAHQDGHAPRPLGWPGGSLVWSWPLEGPAYEILLFTIPQVPNLLGHLVISSNSDEGILVPSPLHDNYSPEKEQDLKECHMWSRVTWQPKRTVPWQQRNTKPHAHVIPSLLKSSPHGTTMPTL